MSDQADRERDEAQRNIEHDERVKEHDAAERDPGDRSGDASEGILPPPGQAGRTTTG